MPSSIPKRQLGKGGPLVTALGYGAMGLSGTYGDPEPDEVRFKMLDHAFASGTTFWDTSEAYGDNEELLGKWIARTPEKRDQLFLCTKFGVHKPATGPPIFRSDPEYVKLACDRSLKRLGVDCIDLFYCHRVDLKTPIEKTIQAMVELKNEGKIKYIGLSDVAESTLRRAHAVHPITAVQLEYSPFALEMESPASPIVQTCRELGIGIVAYSPLGRGFLTGQLKSPDDFAEGDFRKNAPKYSKENWGNNMRLVDMIVDMAKEKGCTPGQLSLAWIMAQGEDVVPIPGTKRAKYHDENVGALDFKLSAEEIKRIRDQVEKVEVVGQRYGAFFDAYSLGETPPLES